MPEVVFKPVVPTPVSKPNAARETREERMKAAIAGVTEMEKQEKAAPPAPGQPPAEAPKTEPPKTAEDRSFEKLAQEKAAVRKLGEKYKALEALERTLPPGALEAVAKAKAAGDPEAILTALGYSYADLAAKKVAAAPAEKKPEADEGPVAELRAEIAALKEDREREKAERIRADARGRIKGLIQGKFKHIEALGRESAIEDYLANYYRENGEPPGVTFEDSVELAARAVEKRLEGEAGVWKKLLTPDAVSSSVTSEAPAPAPGAPSKTLTNAGSTAPSGATKATSRDELFAQLLADQNVWGAE